MVVLIKQWTEAVSGLGIDYGPLGKFLDGRTLKATLRKRPPVVLEGRTGEIQCCIAFGRGGKVEVELRGLPELFVGTKPLLSFPAALKLKDIVWASGPHVGVVQAEEEVTPAGSLRLAVANACPKSGDVSVPFSQVRVMSETGSSQPACSIRVVVEPGEVESQSDSPVHLRSRRGMRGIFGDLVS
jgi:hypothetical protein